LNYVQLEILFFVITCETDDTMDMLLMFN